MIHLRIVAPEGCAEQTLDLLRASPAVLNVVHLHGAATKPSGDLILCDVAREDASVLLSDLRELGLDENGSIAMEQIDTAISAAHRAAEKAAAGAPADAVIWEEVTERTSEEAELSVSFLAFMVIAMLIAAVGVLLDQPILIVGAMVVGPEFGPLAGFCVAVVHLRRDLARRSIAALAAGFPFGILCVFLASLVFRGVGLGPDEFDSKDHPLTQFISSPDAFSFIVAYLAGTAGVLSLTSAKSGALIGVLISVATIPAAGNVGLAAAYGNWGEALGASQQLLLNLSAIALAGIVTLYIQRRLYLVRRRRHLAGPERRAAGLPVRRGDGASGDDGQEAGRRPAAGGRG